MQEIVYVAADLEANVQELYGPSAFRGARQPASMRCNGNYQSRVKMLGRIRGSWLELLQGVLLERTGLKQTKNVRDRAGETVPVVMDDGKGLC